MHRIKEAILVEGRYDKNALRQVVDALVLESAGFGVFNDKQKQAFLRRIAAERGLIVLTDSDAAGFVIRNFVRGCVDPALLKHAYIPDIRGKEKRKSSPSKEGKLGVEGMRPEVLLDALRRAGASFDDTPEAERAAPITKADLYALGLSGRTGSGEARQALLKRLDLPERLSADALLEVLNVLMSREDFLTFAADPQRSPAAKP